MLIIGEKLNSSIPKSREMMENRDRDGLQQLAVQQAAAGADYIDVNAGTFISTEVEMLQWLVELVQEVTDKPLCLDTTNPEALAASLSICQGKALINSISLEGDRFEEVSSLAMKYGASVIGLCQKTDKIPNNAVERIESGTILAQKLLKIGLEPEQIFLDPLVTAQSVEETAARTTYRTVAGLKQEVPFARVVCGLSNVSFGLPKRKLINRTFLAMLMAAGLDGAIMDPLDSVIMTEVLVAEMLAGKDPLCRRYLKAYKRGLIS